MHTSSVYAIAAPLRRGEDFCGHHDPKKFTGVRCAGIKKHGKGPCNVWSGSLYEDAAPLRRGSPYCHHHRLRCAGYTRTGYRCTVTSSSENAHAEPLRMGKAFCTHHQCDELSQEECNEPEEDEDEDDEDEEEEEENRETTRIYQCETCGELCDYAEARMHACTVDESEARYDSQEELYSDDDEFEECSESLCAFN